MKNIVTYKILNFLQCESTQLEAQKLLKKNITLPFVVDTFSQTVGKTMGSDTWENQPNKNITFSVIDTPSYIQSKEIFYLSMIVSNAIHEVLKKILPPNKLKVKWPNDIYYNDKKLGGILINNNISNFRIEKSIIGIGLNVNQTYFKYPIATSLKLETGIDYNIKKLKKLIQNEVIFSKIRYNKKFDKKEIKQTYLKNLYKISTISDFQSSKTFRGIIKDIDDTGKLYIETYDNEIRSFHPKEVSLLKDNVI